MWAFQKQELTNGRGLQLFANFDQKSASFADVVQGWQNNAEFRAMFNRLLADVPYSAFRWETPLVTTDTLTQPFEFVVLDNPMLARRPDPDAFSEHFRSKPEATVLEFANLGGDAIMIVPSPQVEDTAYGHLAAFVRHAPETQQDTLWQMVGEAMRRRVGTKPVWLSTAGGGVSWLHVRLDDRPKYYGYGPYRQ